MTMRDDTIYAVATANVKSAIAVIRISGPSADEVLDAFAIDPVPVRRSALRILRGTDGAAIDEVLVLRFSEGASFTGEKTIELHCHGGVAVTRAILRQLAELPGFRLADPGEFTRRAVEAGRFDLTQAEAIADLIEAETEMQRRLAMRQYGGELGQKTAIWREDLISALALLEAGIDFADDDLPELSDEVISRLRKVAVSLADELDGAAAAERIRDGFVAALVGRPNTGKSTLFNCLAHREMAIVSDVAGTTRDILELRLDLRGIPVTLLDMAGIREVRDEVEAIGVKRAVERAREADIRIFLLEGEDAPVGELLQAHDIQVTAKADIQSGPNDRLAVSGLSGQGVDALLEKLRSELESRSLKASSLVRERHRRAISEALSELSRAEAVLISASDAPELASEHVRWALRALDGLIGRVHTEHLLDEIFSRFCLGK